MLIHLWTPRADQVLTPGEAEVRSQAGYAGGISHGRRISVFPVLIVLLFFGGGDIAGAESVFLATILLSAPAFEDNAFVSLLAADMVEGTSRSRWYRHAPHAFVYLENTYEVCIRWSSGLACSRLSPHPSCAQEVILYRTYSYPRKKSGDDKYNQGSEAMCSVRRVDNDCIIWDLVHTEDLMIFVVTNSSPPPPKVPPACGILVDALNAFH